MPTTAKKTTRDEMPEITAEQWEEARPRRRGDRRLELPLEGLRKAFGKTQVAVSEGSDIDQPYVSRLERRDDLNDVELGTLRRYVAACGGVLELVVVAPNGARIVLRDVRSVAAPPETKPRRKR